MDNEGYTNDSSDTLKWNKKDPGVIEGPPPEESISSRNSIRSIFAQCIATFINCISWVSLGILSIIPSVVIESVFNAKDGLSLNAEQVSWYASFLPIVQPFGCFFGGFLQKYIGRRHGLTLMNISAITSWFILYRATTVEMLYITSILMGISIGFTEAVLVMYVCEISTENLRGILVSYACCNYLFGTVLIFILASLMSWRTLCLYSIGLCAATILLLIFIPESPVWLINKGKDKEVIKSLCWLRGWVSESDVKEEFEELRQEMNNSSNKKIESSSSWKRALNFDHLLDRSTLQPFMFLTCFFFFSCAVSLLGARSYYLIIFKDLNVPMDPTLLALMNAVASVLGNMACCFLVKVFGKRFLSLLTTFLSSTLCVLMGLYIIFRYEINQPWIFAVLMVSIGFTQCLGIVILPWMMLGEVYPIRTTHLATGITGAIFYVTIFLFVKTYYYLELLLKTEGIFILYGVIGYVGILYLWIYMPETEGKSLAEIGELFAKDSRRWCTHFRKKKK